jgi:hypothetical protein
MFERRSTGVALEADGTVRIVELMASIRTIVLSRMETFPPVETEPISSWQNALGKAREAGYDVDGSVVGITDSLVYRKTLAFPFRSRGRIMQILVSELEGEIPVPSDTVVADFLPGRQVEKGIRGIAFACSKQTVARVLEMFGGGARLKGVQPLSVGLAGYFRAAGIRDGAALSDSGQEEVVVGIRSSFIESVRRLPWTGRLEGAAVAEAILEAAPEKSCVVAACQPETAAAIRDLPGMRDLQFFDLEDPPGTGGVPRLSPGYAVYAATVGVALRGLGGRGSLALDLRQGPFSAVTPFSTLKGSLWRTAALGFLVFLLFIAGLLMGAGREKARYDAYSARIESEFRALFPDARFIPGQEVAETGNKLQQLQKKAADLSGFDGVGALAVLTQLSAAIPEGIALKIDEFSYDSKKLRLEGTVSSFDSVDKVKNALDQDPFFAEVQVQNARVGADMNRITFRLQMEVR